MKQEVDSRKGVWETPQDFFDQIQAEFSLNIDVAASAENTKLPRYFDEAMDGLVQDWTGLRCWMNPPYGHSIGRWIKKAAESNAEIVVALLPARTGPKWFHNFIYQKPNVDIRFLPGRIKFSGMAGAGMFDSMIVIWKGKSL